MHATNAVAASLINPHGNLAIDTALFSSLKGKIFNHSTNKHFDFTTQLTIPIIDDNDEDSILAANVQEKNERNRRKCVVDKVPWAYCVCRIICRGKGIVIFFLQLRCKTILKITLYLDSINGSLISAVTSIIKSLK